MFAVYSAVSMLQSAVGTNTSPEGGTVLVEKPLGGEDAQGGPGRPLVAWIPREQSDGVLLAMACCMNASERYDG